MTYKEIIKEVSQELNLPYEVVDLAYKSYWKFIREKIEILPLKENLTKEDFSKLKTNFSLPYLGKLSCTYARMENIKKKFIISNKIRKDAESKKD